MSTSLDQSVSVFSSSVSPGLLSAFAENSTAGMMALALFGIVVAIVLCLFFVLPFTARILLPLPKDTRLADFLPFTQLLPDKKTLICQNGEVVQCLEIAGCDTSFVSKEEREKYYQIRKQWLDALAEMGIHIRVFLLRERLGVQAVSTNTNPVLKAIFHRWHHTFEQSYHNRHIIVLSRAGKHALEVIEEAAEHSMALLGAYHPRFLTQEENRSAEERLLSFWGKIASPLSKPMPAGSGEEVSDLITADTVIFGEEEGSILFQSGEKNLHMAVIGIRMFGEHTDEHMIQELSHIAGEITLLHLIEPWNKAKASLLLLQQKRMLGASHLSAGVEEQFTMAREAIEGLDESRQSLSLYSLVLFINASSKQELISIEQQIRTICAHYGATAVREGIASQASWFSQFPSYHKWPRSYKFFSGNIATLITLHTMPKGIPHSDWGDGPIALFHTAGKTAYRFQFHVSSEKEAVAHGVTIWPTGGGKTTLICFLTAMAMRHPHLRCYIFDRYQGAKIFCRAVRGSYLHFHAGHQEEMTELNPFQCKDTAENRHFLQLWLQHISGCDDPSSLEQIGFAIQENFSGLPFGERALTNVFDACFTPESPLRQQLKKWVDPSLYGGLFNAKRDTLDLESSRLIGFDFTRIFEDEALTRATFSYLMHRIQTTLTERQSPALIFIDETEPMLKHPMFRQHFMVMLQEYRKRGAGIIASFQRPEAITQTGMGEIIRGQAQTLYFLPNPAAKEEDYLDWKLSDREWAFITGKLPLARKLKRAVLLKRAGGESVVLDTDLSSLGPYIRIFSSGRASVHLATELEKQFGEGWVAHYLNGA